MRRLVHVSITNPDPASGLPSFRREGQIGQSLRELEGVSFANFGPAAFILLKQGGDRQETADKMEDRNHS